MMWIALWIVVALGAGVVWLIYRAAWELARFEEWDEPIVKAKRRQWR